MTEPSDEIASAVPRSVPGRSWRGVRLAARSQRTGRPTWSAVALVPTVMAPLAEMPLATVWVMPGRPGSAVDPQRGDVPHGRCGAAAAEDDGAVG